MRLLCVEDYTTEEFVAKEGEVVMVPRFLARRLLGTRYFELDEETHRRDRAIKNTVTK